MTKDCQETIHLMRRFSGVIMWEDWRVRVKTLLWNPSEVWETAGASPRFPPLQSFRRGLSYRRGLMAFEAITQRGSKGGRYSNPGSVHPDNSVPISTTCPTRFGAVFWWRQKRRSRTMVRGYRWRDAYRSRPSTPDRKPSSDQSYPWLDAPNIGA